MKKILTFVFVATILGCKSQITAQVTEYPNLAQMQQEIVGTWISNDDLLWKISFDSNGVRKDFYENVLMEIYNYSISNSCGWQNLSKGYFLKTTDANNQNTTCDLLNSFYINNNGKKVMSVTTERGQLSLFTKE